MRHFAKKAALVLMLFAMPFLAVLFCDLSVSDLYSETYYAELPEMADRLYDAEGPKIIVVGTSSVAFGVDSALIEEQLEEAGCEYTVCNFGLYGALGSKLMLELARDSIQEGDILVFAPEWQEQCISGYFSAQEAWRALDGRWDLISRLSDEMKTALTAEGFSHTAEKFSWARRKETPKGSGVYAKASFDERCDMKYADRPANVMAGGVDANNPICLDSALLDEDYAEYLNGYAAELSDKGAVMYFSFAPMNAEAVEDASEETVYEFYLELCSRLDFEIISDPNTCILDSGWFYDSNYHLNEAGMTVRSLLLLNDLKNALGITAATTAETPEEPDPASLAGQAGVPADGENQDAACFSYEELEDGTLEITGVCEEYRERESFILPCESEGVAVTSVRAGALADCSGLREITIQENLTSLPDGMFSGCASLEKVILRQADPTLVSVGWELLEGAPQDCILCVPEEGYSAYCGNYFWGHYMGRLQAYE